MNGPLEPHKIVLIERSDIFIILPASLALWA
jgi:hypothetical protein